MDELLTGKIASSATTAAPNGRSVSSGRSLRVLLKRMALTALFALCLYPISVGGLGVNYFFVLLPLVTALVTGRLRNPGEMLLFAIAFYVLIFFVASLYQYDLAAESTRRFASFAIFISMFSYAFITIDSDKIIAFKTAVVAISVYLSALSAYRLLELAATRIVGFEAKDLIGTQRLGFIYVIAFWLVYLDRQQKDFWGVARYPILFVLIVGLCLTFSRSSIVAILVSFLLFAVVRHGGWLKTFNLKSVGNAIVTVIGAIVIAALVFRVFPLVFQFFGARLFGFFVDPDALFNTFADSTTSEGTRLYIASRLLDFVVRNPLTGSGYLGAWVLRDAFGSAHGQYMDVLFRTGPIGFFLYLCILIGLMRYLWRSHEALFWGVAGVLVYGLFHETFKESQGAFIFAFLVGLMAQSWRDRRAARSRSKVAAKSRSLPSAPSPAFEASETGARNS